MPKINILSVQCTTPDEIDKDETYLKLDGKKIWPIDAKYHRLDTGDKVEVNVALDVAEGWYVIELWDYDYMSLNDHLGNFKFLVDDQLGEFSTSMTLVEQNSTASYILYWEIV